MGYKIMVCPKSVVYHVGGHIIAYGSPLKIYRNFRNSLIVDLKNMRTGELLWKIPSRMTLDLVYEIKALLSGNFTEYINIVKAHLHFLMYLPKWLKKRRDAQRLVSNPNRAGMYGGSVVFAYFIRQKKKFSDLKW